MRRSTVRGGDNDPLLPRNRSNNTDGYEPASGRGGGGYSGALVGILSVLVIGFLGWAIATTVVMTQRVDPPCSKKCADVDIPCESICTNFAVIGGGTTGNSVANKLSENGYLYVDVFEAGDNYVNDPEISLVGDVFKFETLPFREPYRYHFSPICQTQYDFASNLYSKNFYATSGRLVGGSSSLNDMWLVRGSVEFWTELETLTGGTGKFAPDSVYEIFRNLEYLDPSPVYTPDATRGTNGVIKAETIPTMLNTMDDNHIIAQTISSSLGIPYQTTTGYNNENGILGGFPAVDMLFDFNTSNPQLRWSSQKAFLNSSVVDPQTLTGVGGRKLRVHTRSTVRRLLFHPIIPTKVIGIEYSDRANVLRTAYVTNEVILSAYYRDAMILQRSGVGPQTVLQQAQVTPVAINENVGRNWKTHPVLLLVFLYGNMTGTLEDPPIPSGLSNTFVADPILGSPTQRGYHMISVSYPSIMGFYDFQLRQQSAGNISIYTSDLNQEAKLVTNTNTNPMDLESWRAHIRQVVLSLTAFDPNIIPLNIDNTTLYNDALLDQWIRDAALVDGTVYHNYASCRMGVNASIGAIDTNFRVYGVTGVRVCDTQSFPFPTDGNPGLAAMGLGQICANTILGIPPPQPPAKKKKNIEIVKKQQTKTTHQHASRAMTNQEQYNAIVNYFEKARETMSSSDAERVISSIQSTQRWQQLCALYCQ